MPLVLCIWWATVEAFKMYLVVVKFREAGGAVREDWLLTRLGKKVGTLALWFWGKRRPLSIVYDASAIRCLGG
jgi:hypothetical protein